MNGRSQIQNYILKYIGKNLKEIAALLEYILIAYVYRELNMLVDSLFKKCQRIKHRSWELEVRDITFVHSFTKL